MEQGLKHRPVRPVRLQPLQVTPTQEDTSPTVLEEKRDLDRHLEDLLDESVQKPLPEGYGSEE